MVKPTGLGGQVSNIFNRGILFAIGLAISGVGSALAGGSDHAPLGYQLMCLQHPSECKAGGASSTNLAADEMVTLKQINNRVNRTIVAANDSGSDVWTVNAGRGDCEDYVLAKRAALIKAGFASSSLRIAYVKTRTGVGHAILVVKSNAGDLVLDNLTSKILTLKQSGYRLVSMSGSNPLHWS